MVAVATTGSRLHAFAPAFAGQLAPSARHVSFFCAAGLAFVGVGPAARAHLIDGGRAPAAGARLGARLGVRRFWRRSRTADARPHHLNAKTVGEACVLVRDSVRSAHGGSGGRAAAGIPSPSG